VAGRLCDSALLPRGGASATRTACFPFSETEETRGRTVFKNGRGGDLQATTAACDCHSQTASCGARLAATAGAAAESRPPRWPAGRPYTSARPIRLRSNSPSKQTTASLALASQITSTVSDPADLSTVPRTNACSSAAAHVVNDSRRSDHLLLAIYNYRPTLSIGCKIAAVANPTGPKVKRDHGHSVAVEEGGTTTTPCTSSASVPDPPLALAKEQNRFSHSIALIYR
jgi:hypothetical protein